MTDTEKSFGYTVISKEISYRDDISPKAKGIYMTLLMLPPEWDFSISGLCKIMKAGKKLIRSGLEELKHAGFVKIIQYRKDNGQIAYKYEVKNRIPP